MEMMKERAMSESKRPVCVTSLVGSESGGRLEVITVWRRRQPMGGV